MIKFFRKIREKLLREHNIRKYSLYALGEIFLVVIGILIALQINNWNENRKDRNNERALITSIINDFENDSLRLNQLLESIGKKATQANNIITIIQQEDSEIDTAKFLSDIYLIGRFIQYDAYIPTFDEIISSGQSGIIKNKTFKEKIKYYLIIADYHETFLYEEGRATKALYNQHARKYFDFRLFSDYWVESGDINLERVRNKFDGQSLLMDFEGFRKDPETLYFLRQVAGTDEELKSILTILKDQFLIPTFLDLKG